MAIVAVKIKLDTTRLDQIARDLDKNRDQVLGMLANELAGQASMNVPPHVDTGALMNGIRAKPMKPGLWWVSDSVEYGIHIEFPGVTRNWAGHPFMVPAAEQVGRDLNNGKTWERLVRK